MATFKVGQRVKKVTHADVPRTYAIRVPVGSEGTVILGPVECSPFNEPGVVFIGYVVRFDQVRNPNHPTDAFSVRPFEIAPLTDPKEEQWAADKVKQVTKPLMVEKPVAKERA